MNLEITKISGINLASEIGAVLVELTDPMEQSDNPAHLHNHVTLEVFVQHPDVTKLSISELHQAAISEARKVLERITHKLEASRPLTSST